MFGAFLLVLMILKTSLESVVTKGLPHLVYRYFLKYHRVHVDDRLGPLAKFTNMSNLFLLLLDLKVTLKMSTYVKV